MRFLPLVLLVGILFNSACVLVFRLKLDRQYSARFVEYRNALSVQLADFTTNTLYSIDLYLSSNVVSRLRSDDSSGSASDDFSGGFALHQIVGDWDYIYFQISGRDFARVGIRNYCVGDSFPRGGIITSIHSDGVEIDGRYWVRNVSRSDGRSRVSSYDSDFAMSRNYKPQKQKELNYEYGLDHGLQ